MRWGGGWGEEGRDRTSRKAAELEGGSLGGRKKVSGHRWEGR